MSEHQSAMQQNTALHEKYSVVCNIFELLKVVKMNYLSNRNAFFKHHHACAI